MTTDQRVRLQALLDKTNYDAYNWILVETGDEAPEVKELLRDHEKLVDLVEEILGVKMPTEMPNTIHVKIVALAANRGQS